MNDEEIEVLLRKAPRPPTPAGLLGKLQADLALPRQTEGRRENRIQASPFLIRWFPALSFAAVFLSCVVAIALQTNQLTELKRENRQLRASVGNLGQLRLENAGFQKQLTEHEELERLRKNADELKQLRAEVTQLRAQTQEMNRMRAENQQLASASSSSSRPHNEAKAADDFFARTEDPSAQALRIQCINYLKQIGLGARIWANDNHDVFPPDFLSMSNELSTPKILVCPGDKARTVAKNWNEFGPANVSYEFLNPNGSEDNPYVVLVRCPVHGIVCLSDGSVQTPGSNSKVVARDGKLVLEPSAQIANPEAADALRQRYGLPPNTNVVPTAPPEILVPEDATVPQDQ